MTAARLIKILAATMLLMTNAADLLADEQPSTYSSERSIAGTITIWGPAHMSALVRTWAEGFRRVQPGIHVAIDLRGSDTAIPGLYSGKADVALLGRENNITDDNGFSRPMQYMPTRFEIATGSLNVPGKSPALVVFVHEDNPLSQISLTQLDAVFGYEHRRGSASIRTWGELGLEGDWANQPINLYGYDISTGTGRFFLNAVLGDSRKLHWDTLREFKDERRADGSIYRAAERILDALRDDPLGIAVACLCFPKSGVKDLALAEDVDGPYVRATRATLTSREYPLTRATYAFVDRPPGMPIDPKVREFLRYVFSRDGQLDIQAEGDYLPLPAATAKVILEQL